jgi:2-polyprenyl-3-methyl-5-hydroxy-6-metoxy-1,4-benzoquinol methylase
MKNSKNNKFMSFARRVFFNEIGGKLKPGSLKGFMDFAFIIFEKASHKFSFLSDYYLKLYEEIVEKEIKLADISSNDSILVIGCGPLPATTVLIYQKTKAYLVGIDIDTKAVKEAKIYLDSQKIKDKIKIENVDGLDYPIRTFDVIFILYGVKRQKEIFEKISKEMKKKCRIIFRTSEESTDKIDKVKINLDTYFSVKDSIKSTSLGSVESFLLKKK